MKGMLALILGLAVGARARNINAQQATPALVKKIQAILDDWAKAYRTKDGAILDRIMGEEYYIMCPEDGKRATKKDELANIKTSKTVFTTATNTVREARQYGNIVVALGEWDAKGSADGKSFVDHESWLTIFEKRNGRWVAIASHEASLPKPGK